tara:strand:- start:232 stop:489 length:258 start_codon:yes stop_codon:yes gene_type:complete
MTSGALSSRVARFSLIICPRYLKFTGIKTKGFTELYFNRSLKLIKKTSGNTLLTYASLYVAKKFDTLVSDGDFVLISINNCYKCF